jgi:hypothetical protein
MDDKGVRYRARRRHSAVIFIPALFAVADPTEGPVATLSAVSFLAAFAVHVSVAEAWIRLTRRSGVARTLAAKAA